MKARTLFARRRRKFDEWIAPAVAASRPQREWDEPPHGEPWVDNGGVTYPDVRWCGYCHKYAIAFAQLHETVDSPHRDANVLDSFLELLDVGEELNGERML